MLLSDVYIFKALVTGIFQQMANVQELIGIKKKKKDVFNGLLSSRALISIYSAI